MNPCVVLPLYFSIETSSAPATFPGAIDSDLRLRGGVAVQCVAMLRPESARGDGDTETCQILCGAWQIWIEVFGMPYGFQLGYRLRGGSILKKLAITLQCLGLSGWKFMTE